MSFSFDYFLIPDGSGPLADIFTSLTFDTIAYYVVTWLYYIFHSTLFSLILYAGLVVLAIWIIMNLISAFNRREPAD